MMQDESSPTVELPLEDQNHIRTIWAKTISDPAVFEDGNPSLTYKPDADAPARRPEPNPETTTIGLTAAVATVQVDQDSLETKHD